MIIIRKRSWKTVLKKALAYNRKTMGAKYSGKVIKKHQWPSPS